MNRMASRPWASVRRSLFRLLIGASVWWFWVPPVPAALPSLAPPGQPTEGRFPNRDEDFSATGRYQVSWGAVRQAGLRVISYELQEATSATGPWVRVSLTRSTRYTARPKPHGRQFFYRVRAQDSIRRWSEWSLPSDGILVDRTAPAVVTVTDDGEITASTDRLHASWSASSDPESGIAAYEYEIRQDSPSGRVIVAWKPAGMALEVTVTSLRLNHGGRYYVGVRAKNRAGVWSKPRYSDGIIVRPIDATPPKIVIVYPQNGALLGAR